MSTPAASILTHDPSSDHFDPDEVLPKNSPLLAPHRPRLRSPTPPFALSDGRSSASSSPGSRRPHPRRMKVRPSQGDALLVGLLGGNQRSEIAIQAGNEVLPSASDSDYEDSTASPSLSPPREAYTVAENQGRGGEARGGNGEGNGYKLSPDVTGAAGGGMTAMAGLATLAAGALAKIGNEPKQEPIDAGPTPPVTEHDVIPREPKPHGQVPPPIPTRRDGPFHDDRAMPPGVPSPYSPSSSNYYSPRDPLPRMDLQSPGRINQNSHAEGLPPIHMTSPRSDTSGQTLPPIRVQLGDIKQLSHDHVEKERLHLEHARRQSTFGHSPPGGLPRLPSMHAPHHGSPPVSPVEYRRGDLPSPGYSIASTTSPGYSSYPPNIHRQHDYPMNGSADNAPSAESIRSPVGAVERMSIDGLTSSPGYYMCKFPGCNAPPFQTQYLLNSHANVHSSARPHYCPMKGCPRGEGGRGFKRKNEMIRHGLVHDSPGYVCPFCPDREHKYPRPDNLQRHVRVHHVDKDKDDPILRDVLSQRPDGPNRGRRRRAGPA
ncbi:hypothetical protein GQ53DRAFT_833072 [Thozetella sp. PMI_491]|nr:hypothetical protein GQ53DRAFT_833072 [Thozetella sp. PMI_491]